MGSSVHAQGPYKHLRSGCPDVKGAGSVFLQQAVFFLFFFPSKFHHQLVKPKPRLRRRKKEQEEEEEGAFPSSSALLSSPPSSCHFLSPRGGGPLPLRLHTTVLTDGSDRLSWPVMSVGGYCCRFFLQTLTAAKASCICFPRASLWRL